MSGEDWTTANQRVLAAESARIKALLGDGDGRAADIERELATARADLPARAAIDMIVQSFGLSDFERDVLLLCATVAMDGKVAVTRGSPANERLESHASFGLALERLEAPHWSALTPVGSLRLLRLVEVDDDRAITSSRLSIDERILHFLAGVNYLDVRLRPIIHEVSVPQLLAESHEDAVESVVNSLDADKATAVVHLTGDDLPSHAEVARRIAARFNLQLHELNSADIPAGAQDADLLATLWQREHLLLNSALLLHVGEHPEAMARFLARTNGLVFLSQTESTGTIRRDVGVRVNKLDAVERKSIWTATLGAAAAGLNGSLDGLSAHFHLGTAEIIRTASELRALPAGPDLLEEALWRACRSATRRRLDDLAQRIEAHATWRDLVLPEPQIATLREIADQVRQRFTVYETWGFSLKSTRGLGISALFCGESGTGKTMAAEVLANELNLDLYRIDLASLVSKYIGETEKNLRRVFDAAEDSGAILLFDEADALFGKRGEVKESTDRYANMEVSYLLQRMETYRGLAILTTNMKTAVDTAFQRRLRFVLQFPFPDAQLRERIWRGAFPAQAPLDEINYPRLAQLGVPGGDIRNIAISAAFLAAADHRPVCMQHLLSAARREAGKRERPFSDAEVRGWI